jgi:hypothetical protein
VSARLLMEVVLLLSERVEVLGRLLSTFGVTSLLIPAGSALKGTLER